MKTTPPLPFPTSLHAASMENGVATKDWPTSEEPRETRQTDPLPPAPDMDDAPEPPAAPPDRQPVSTQPPKRSHRESFSEEARHRVERAVRNGVIVRDQATGLATVIHPEAPSQPNPYTVEHFDVLERHRAAVAEAADVEWLLDHPAIQLVALRALDVALQEVARKDAIDAMPLARELALLTVGHAPSAVIERALPLLRREKKASVEDPREPWMAALPVVIATICRVTPPVDPRDDERTRSELILELLEAVVDDVPRAFRQRKPEHLRAADRFLSTMRLTGVSDDQQPPQSRGPAVTPWRAASEFARRFGVTSMPMHPR